MYNIVFIHGILYVLPIDTEMLYTMPIYIIIILHGILHVMPIDTEILDTMPI